MKKFLLAAAAAAAVLLIVLAVWTFAARRSAERAAARSQRIVRGTGFVRGRVKFVLRNKFSGYVTKINYFSQARVKKGEVILEYDDLDVRTAIAKLENSVAEQKKTVELKRIALQLRQIDPLPSEYRNTKWKVEAAKQRLERLSHELDVYRHLFRNKSVSELTLREKAQAVKDAEVDVRSFSCDLAKLDGGLGQVSIQQAKDDLAAAETKLRDLERELEITREQRKYYRLVAPADGVCITNSDSLYGYYSAGTEAVEIHVDDRKLVYAYFDEKDFAHIVEGRPCRFRSNTYDCDEKGFATVVPYQVRKERLDYGDQVHHLVKFRVVEEPVPLRIDSIGAVEIIVK